MNLLSAENISKNYSERQLLNKINLGINEGDKIGFIGINGTGKTTLLKIIADIEEPDSGTIIKGNFVRVQYLPQNPDFDSDATILEQVFKTNSQIIEYEAKTTLTKLGITDFNIKIGTLSGGQKKRVALAIALVNPSEILILDEPTNHLDNEAIDWLEQYLNKRKGALIMITHDRYFLDRVVNQIIELDRGVLYSYQGNYSYFLEKKIERAEIQASSQQKQQRLLKNELAWIRKGAKARTTKQKARIDRYEKLNSETTSVKEERMQISLNSSRLGKKIIELQHISKAFNNNQIINDFSYMLQRNDRIGIVGANGSGKSTLLNIISRIIKPDSGKVEIGETVKIGVYAQEMHKINSNIRVIDYIKETAEYLTNSDGQQISASQMLERFLFPPGVQWGLIEKLSGGEKRRLYLLKVLMESPNILLLDEPTNDLDIQTLVILEDYLEDFKGAVIAVSHDRYFLDRIVEKIFAFERDGKITEYTGNYSDYKEKSIAKNTTFQLNQSEKSSNNDTQVKNYKQDIKEKPLKFSFKEQKEYAEIDGVIAELEDKLSNLEVIINAAVSDYSLLQQLLSEKRELEEELNKNMDRWVYLNDLADKIANKSELS